MIIIKSILIIILNLTVYVLLGSLALRRKDKELNPGLCLVTGFFLYYILFFLVCFPFMIKYRPLSWLVKTFFPIIAFIIAVSLVLNLKKLKSMVSGIIQTIRRHPYLSALIGGLLIVQIILVTTTYNFTLDAAYYVSNAATSVETDMINVYDPFTGAWLDHYEVRYLFATYSIADAAMCFITGLPALVETKLVMSATVIIIVNVLYVMTAKYLFKDPGKATVMVYMMFLVNMLFYTIFTSSLFLFTRTYEGKTVIGNISLIAVFYIFMLMANDEEITRPWLMLFIISLGSMTISSSANMLIPAEISLLFIPYMLIKRTFKPVFKYIACIMPGIAIVLIYVLYVKGYFVFYTYPT